MCIAILQKKGAAKLTKAQLFSGWTSNKDGGGFAYTDDDGTVMVRAGFEKYNDFAKMYDGLYDRFIKNGPLMVHMRFRSAGGMGKKNCHPFKIKGGALCHNGTMFYPKAEKNVRSDSEDAKSDTRIFASHFYNILDLDSVRKAENDILKAVGLNNKILFLYDGGEYHIINERAGYWDNDTWFSNQACKVRNTYPGYGEVT